jgi:hypothetical protein
MNRWWWQYKISHPLLKGASDVLVLTNLHQFTIYRTHMALPHKPDFSLQVTQQLTGSVQFELSSLWFSNFALFLNSELDLWSGSVKPSNFELNFGSVWESSGSNFGSELNCSSSKPVVNGPQV